MTDYELIMTDEEFIEELERLETENQYYYTVIEYLQTKLAELTDEKFCVCASCVGYDVDHYKTRH